MLSLISRILPSLALMTMGGALLASSGLLSILGGVGALMAVTGTAQLAGDLLQAYNHPADSAIVAAAHLKEAESFSLSPELAAGKKLNAAQINTLVVDRADFFENEVNPLLPASARQKLDLFLATAANSYAKDTPPPTVAEAREAFGNAYVLLPEGHEKKELRTLMDSLSPVLATARPQPQLAYAR